MTTVFIITGEPSGDLLGARLMQSLKRLHPGLVFKGVGGERMAAEGLQVLYPQSDLAVFGLWEVIPKIMLIFRRLRETVAAVKAEKPAVVITIDSPDFCFRVTRRLKATGIPLIHYVAPSVWAWRPGRAKTIAQFLTHILTLFAFEPPYFTKEGLAATFVGHPIIENGAAEGNAARFRQQFRVPDDAPILTMLAGSRGSEVKFLLDTYKAVAQRIAKTIPHVVIAMPTMPPVEKTVRAHAATWGLPVYVFLDDAPKYDAFAASRAALAASGTVNLEVALAKLPMVVAYKISWVTRWLYGWLVKINLFSPVNILLKREAVPEAMQSQCNPDYIMEKLMPLLTDEAARAAQIKSFDELRPLLQDGAESPSDKAAKVVLGYLPHAGTC